MLGLSNVYADFFVTVMIIVVIAKAIYVIAQLRYRFKEEPVSFYNIGYGTTLKEYVLNEASTVVKAPDIEHPELHTSINRKSRYAEQYKFYTSCKDPFEIVRANKEDPEMVIAEKYRELIKDWFPEDIFSLDLTEEEREQATKIMQIIDIAYIEALQRRAKGSVFWRDVKLK